VYSFVRAVASHVDITLGDTAVQNLQGVVVLRVTPSEGMIGEQSCALPEFGIEAVGPCGESCL